MSNLAGLVSLEVGKLLPQSVFVNQDIEYRGLVPRYVPPVALGAEEKLA